MFHSVRNSGSLSIVAPPSSAYGLYFIVQNECFSFSHEVHNPASSKKVEKNHTPFLEMTLTLSTHILVAKTQSYDHTHLAARESRKRTFYSGWQLKVFLLWKKRRMSISVQPEVNFFFFFVVLGVAVRGLSPLCSFLSCQKFLTSNFSPLYFHLYHYVLRRIKELKQSGIASLIPPASG